MDHTCLGILGAKMKFKVFGLIKLTKWLFGAKTQGEEMALSDTVTAQLAAIQTGETSVLTGAITQAFNDGVNSVVPGGSVVTSAQEALDIAAAVANQVGIDAAALTSAVAAAQAVDLVALQAVQVQLSTAQAQDASDQSAISGLQSAVSQAQAALVAIAALFPPLPVVPPVAS